MTKYYFEEEEREKRRTVVSTALAVAVTMSALSFCLMVLFRDSLSGMLFGGDGYETIVGLFAVVLLAGAIEGCALDYVRLQQRPWLFVAISTVKLALQLVLNVVLVVVLELGVFGIAVSSAVSSTLLAAGLLVYVLRNTGRSLSADLAIRMLRFSWPLWLAGLAAIYVGSANRYYIRLFGSLDEVGQFELAAKFAAIVTSLIWLPIMRFWQVERFRYYHERDDVRVFQIAFQSICAVLVIASVFIALFAEPAIRLMAAPEFWEAHHAVPWLLIAAVVGRLTVFLNFSYHVTDKTTIISRNGYLMAGIATILYLAITPEYGYVGAAVALAGAHVAQFAIVRKSSIKYFDMGLGIKPVLAMAGVSVCGYMVAERIAAEAAGLSDVLIRSGVFGLCCIGVLSAALMDKATREYARRTLMPALSRRLLRERFSGNL